VEVMTIESRVLKEIQQGLSLPRLPQLTDRFVTDLGCDSLDLMEIIMFLEDEFCIELVDEEALKCETVADAVALVTASQPS
jgi:acyl carrier protein